MDDNPQENLSVPVRAQGKLLGRSGAPTEPRGDGITLNSAARPTYDPVAPAKRSEAALRKIQTKKLDDGSRASSFRTLLRLLSNIVRNKCRRPEAGPDEPTFDVTTTPDSKQQRAYDLLKGITV